MSELRWLLYGAYGYTGRLVAAQALARGARPILAGRDGVRLAAMAQELGLEHRVADLGDAGQLRAALEGVAVVAHCAGPFSATSRPMVDACIESGVHYLDITGEIAVLEAVHGRDAQARESGVALLSGAGFDVVPSDCLAATVAAALPGATRLELAFTMVGGVSRGTARTALESLSATALARVDGVIADVPRELRRRSVRFGTRTVPVVAVSWGDVATAMHSTGIGNVVVYTPMPRALGAVAAVAGAAANAPLIGGAARRALGAAVGRMPEPDDAGRARNHARLWACASDASGNSVEARLVGPNAYDLTADAVVRIAGLLASGAVPPGAHTPSQALGAGFASQLDGVSITMS